MNEETMKLWLLRPSDITTTLNSPWEPWYDKSFGFVIRAITEQQARELAQDNGGYETDEIPIINVWLDPKYSTCSILENNGEFGIVIQDFRSA